ncbi:MAG TPA: hypothetical protein VFK59_13090 [Actinomycetota bacterium]|nr:hypothetical protein [Actinomycetota bacterium]
MFNKRRRDPQPVEPVEEEEIAYEDAWYRSLKAQAERRAATSTDREEPEPKED